MASGAEENEGGRRDGSQVEAEDSGAAWLASAPGRWRRRTGSGRRGALAGEGGCERREAELGETGAAGMAAADALAPWRKGRGS